MANTGKFVDRLNADIIGICEVENVVPMRQFRSLLREKLRYEILIDGTDPRGIDVGLYSKFPLGNLRTNIHFRPPGRRNPLFPRDCMEVEIPMAGGRSKATSGARPRPAKSPPSWPSATTSKSNG